MAEDDVIICSDELEICESVGTGSTCEVFKARFKGQLVAVKQASARGPALAAVREQREFSRELAVLTRLRHPNLVLFIGCTRGRPFRIVSEFCGGGSLHSLLHLSEHIDLTWKQRLVMCSQVTEAMAYLHGARPLVMHRDLKSHNLLLSQPIYNAEDHPRVKVADFGLARMINPDVQNDLTTDVGTCHWKAPEMMLERNYDEKIDVYSFAIVVYEIVCRMMPFDELHINAFVRKISAGDRPDLEESAEPGCPLELLQVITRGWDQDSSRRPSFDELADLLRPLRGPLRPDEATRTLSM